MMPIGWNLFNIFETNFRLICFKYFRPKSTMPVILMNDAEAFGKEKNPLSKTKEQNGLAVQSKDDVGTIVEFPQLKGKAS